MPFALILIGAVLLISAIQGTERDLGHELYGDFTGSNSFVWWAIAIVCVGAIGYVPQMKKFSDTFLGLILMSLLIREGGFVSQFNAAVSGATTNPATLPEDSQSAPTSSSSSSGGSSGGSSTDSEIAEGVEIAAMVAV